MSYWNHTGRCNKKLIPGCPKCSRRLAVYWREATQDFWCVGCRMPFKLSDIKQKENNIEAIECSKIQMMVNG